MCICSLLKTKITYFFHKGVLGCFIFNILIFIYFDIITIPSPWLNLLFSGTQCVHNHCRLCDCYHYLTLEQFLSCSILCPLLVLFLQSRQTLLFLLFLDILQEWNHTVSHRCICFFWFAPCLTCTGRGVFALPSLFCLNAIPLDFYSASCSFIHQITNKQASFHVQPQGILLQWAFMLN